MITKLELRHAFGRLRTLAITVMVCLSLGTIGLKAQTLQIDSLKANWIEGFAEFSSWHEDETPESLTVAFLSSPEVAAYLEKRASQTQRSRSLKSLAFTLEDSLQGIDILYVGKGQKEHWKALSERCFESCVLMIGEEDGILQHGGAIQFIVRRNQLQFAIDAQNARKAGVEISSKVLELAVELKP